MKKNVEMEQDGKEYERFESILRQVVKVPKEEILKREKEEKQKNKVKRKAKKS